MLFQCPRQGERSNRIVAQDNKGSAMLNHRFIATVIQLNPVVGDIIANLTKIRETYIEADDRSVDLVVTPELSVTGCPLEDLVNSRDFLDAAAAALDVLRLATRNRQACLLVGVPLSDDAGVYNAAVALRNGEIIQIVRKKSPPECGMFDETRDFATDAGTAMPFEHNGVKVGVLIGDDVRRDGPSRELAANGADLLIATNASPFQPDALRVRVVDVAASRVRETGLPLLYVNMVGGQDEVVFDGGSFCLDAAGNRVIQLPLWEECDMDCDLSGPFAPIQEDDFPDNLETTWRAMMMGLADYVRKSGFSDVVLGLSGGMDSALVAAVAGDALGPEHVHCVRMPSRYTAELSNTAALEMCRTWGFDMYTLPIGEMVAAATATLTPISPDGLKRLTTENMQARARGYLLMTLSNDRGWLLLSTGNKSEIAAGYATLYGDMCGAYNPVKDVFKTTVFALARWRNDNCPEGLLGPAGVVIPTEIIERPPSAELAPDQKDTDSLPPYPVLDAILEEIVEKRTPNAEIVAKGYDRDLVERVYRMVKRAEYKRRQGAPGAKTTCRAIARNRRLPMVNGFDPEMIAKLRALAKRRDD